ncbi:MAG: TonB-dependent receptor [Bacteroidales bacterium]|nr:TonB-dependent receptor [Bacteroidales bacterium]
MQTIRGVVRDANTREALLGANVILAETNTGTITDPEGKFVIPDVPVGRYYLHVRYVGYEPVVIPELLVGSGKEVVLEIDMQTSFSALEEVVVKPRVRKDRPVNGMANVSARTFSVEEAGRYAGALDDPARMAGNFAGVTTAGVNVNAIVVRGNAPKGLVWRLEGVDIPVPSHFSGSNVAGGGGLTIFSGRLLANSDFYTGAFPAEYGNATAGVFDMKLRNGNNRKREYAFQAGIQGVEAAAEGPFRTNGSGSYLFNYRYSTMALIFPLLPELKDSDEIPFYQDLSFKLNMPAGAAGNFSLWGIGGLSHTSMKGTDDPAAWAYPESRVRMNFHYNMGAGGLTHTRSLSASTLLRSTLALNAGEHSYHKKSRLDAENPTVLQPLFGIDITQGMAIVSSTLSHTVNPRLTLRTGVEANDHFYTLNGNARNFAAGEMEKILGGKDNSWLLKGFLQGKYMPLRTLTLTGGVHASWFELNDETRLEPRLSASLQVHPSHRFSIGYGNHSQVEPLFVYFVSRKNMDTGEEYFPNKSLGRMGAHHFVIGYDWTLNENLHVKVEPYYQQLYDVPVVENSPYSMLNFMKDWTFDKLLVNEGTGRNAGIDFTLERFLKGGYYYMTNASVYTSEYKGGDGITRRTRYDGGYVLNILGGREWQVKAKNLLGVNVRCSLMGPYWYHPVDEVASHLAKDIVYDENMPFNDRYSKLETITDITLTYRMNGEKVASVLSLQVNNIIGQQYRGKRYNLVTNSIENEFFSSPVPFLSYKVEF